MSWQARMQRGPGHVWKNTVVFPAERRMIERVARATIGTVSASPCGLERNTSKTGDAGDTAHGIEHSGQRSCHAQRATRPRSASRFRLSALPSRPIQSCRPLGPLGPMTGHSMTMTSSQKVIDKQPFVIHQHHNYQNQPHNRNLVLDLLLLSSARQPSKPHHRTKLQAILLPNHALVLLPKLTGQLFAPSYVLRTDKINCNFDRICQIGNLKHNDIG